jgi:protein TonB
MIKSFFPYLFGVFLLHGVLLLGALFQLNDQQVSTSFKKMGPEVLNLKVLSNVVKNSFSLDQSLKDKKTSSSPKMPSPLLSETPLNEDSSSAAAPISTGSPLVGKEDALALYKAELRALIDKYKSYPPLSKRLGQMGIVVVAFTLLKDGHIIDVRLVKPSRYERLNFSALEAVKKVEKFKPIPQEIGELKMDIKVPVKFVTI